MSRSYYDIDPAGGEVLCTYTEGGEQEKLKSVSSGRCPVSPIATYPPVVPLVLRRD
jgi:hypothetical protein